MVKHRQLARQVGAFDEFFLKSSADLDLKITYSVGTTFVFGSWICEAGGDGKLRTRLREEKEFDDKNNPVEQELTKKIMKLLTSNPTQKGEESGYETDSEKEIEYDSDSDKKMEHNSDSDKKMEHDSNSDKEMEHNPNSDAIFKTKEPSLIGLRHDNDREGIQPVQLQEELRGVRTVQHNINLPTLYPRQDEFSKKNIPGGSARRDDHDSYLARLCGALAGFFRLKQSPD